MQFENWITNISSHLPDYITRVHLILFFVIWIILLSLLLYLLSLKKLSNFKTNLFILFFAISLLIPLLTYFIYPLLFERVSLFLLIPNCVLSFLFLLKFVLYKFKKGELLKILYITDYSLIFLLTLLLLVVSLFAVPKIRVSSGNELRILNSSEEIVLDFSSPIKQKDLKVNLYPENNVRYEMEYFLGMKELIEQIRIIPLTSFLPDQKIVVYTTGIQRMFPFGYKHENSQEFFTPSAPNIQEVVLGTDTQNVSIEQPITLELDTNDQDFIEWEVVFTPEAEYEIQRDEDSTVVIQPLKLKQGTDYTLQIIKNIIRYDTTTFEKISTESEEIVKEITFRTIPAPGILDYNRSNGALMSNSEPLTITFETPLRDETLEGKVSITPIIDGDISLSEDKKQLIFTPKSSFAKGTEYVLTIASGVENTLGGYIEQDLSISFTTPGYVSLQYASPRNYATGISNTQESISLTFNQPVDHSSVESGFTISPHVDGIFSWSGNTIYYKFSSALSYGTKYTINISSGIKAIYGIDSNKVISTSFTTKDETVLLSVPLYYQSEKFTCNLAAAKMVLAYRGVSSSESGIRSAIGENANGDPNSVWVTGYGVHSGPLNSYIRSQGVSTSLQSGMGLSSALEEVKKGNPVLVYVYNGVSIPKGAFTLPGGYTGYKGMHSEVIVGYIGKPDSASTIITNDPWRGKRYISRSTFLGLWSYLGYIGIVIY